MSLVPALASAVLPRAAAATGVKTAHSPVPAQTDLIQRILEAESGSKMTAKQRRRTKQLRQRWQRIWSPRAERGTPSERENHAKSCEM